MSQTQMFGRHRVRFLPPDLVHIVFEGDVSRSEARGISEFFASATEGIDTRYLVDLRKLGTIAPDGRRELAAQRKPPRTDRDYRVDLAFIGANLHYSYSSPELVLRRGDLVGSSARADLGSHTLTFDGRVRTPEAFGFRVYGLLGGGFTRFTVNIKQTVETPFPEGVPDNVISPVFTFGVGIEKSVLPLIRLKFEARDYVTAISRDFFSPGGRWHRVAVYGGIVLGR